MTDAATVGVAYVTLVESLIIIAGNVFTIFMFWKHRNKLKRTSLLLINLAVADLLVGFSQLTMVGIVTIPLQMRANITSTRHISITIALQTSLFYTSLFSLVLISLERAFALIWPLRHRIASTKGYINSVIFVWLAGISVGAMALLAEYKILDPVLQMVALCSIIVASLITICVSYLAIRTRLNCKPPAIDFAHNRQNGPEQNAKLSRTLFIVTAVSVVCFFPSTVGYLIHYLCSKCVPSPLVLVFTIFYFANSIINPIIYSFRMSIFRETLKQVKLTRQAKQYRVSYMPRRAFVLNSTRICTLEVSLSSFGAVNTRMSH